MYVYISDDAEDWNIHVEENSANITNTADYGFYLFVNVAEMTEKEYSHVILLDMNPVSFKICGFDRTLNKILSFLSFNSSLRVTAYVDFDAGSDNNDCTTIETHCATLSQGILKANNYISFNYSSTLMKSVIIINAADMLSPVRINYINIESTEEVL
jgi:hypothetical protein